MLEKGNKEKNEKRTRKGNKRKVTQKKNTKRAIKELEKQLTPLTLRTGVNTINSMGNI